jgi:hypothetical protein
MIIKIRRVDQPEFVRGWGVGERVRGGRRQYNNENLYA